MDFVVTALAPPNQLCLRMALFTTTTIPLLMRKAEHTTGRCPDHTLK